MMMAQRIQLLQVALLVGWIVLVFLDRVLKWALLVRVEMDSRSYWAGLGWVFTKRGLGAGRAWVLTGCVESSVSLSRSRRSRRLRRSEVLPPSSPAGRPPRRQAAPAALRVGRTTCLPRSALAALSVVRDDRPSRCPRWSPSTPAALALPVSPR